MPRSKILLSAVRSTILGGVFLIVATTLAPRAFGDEVGPGQAQLIAEVDESPAPPIVPRPPAPPITGVPLPQPAMPSPQSPPIAVPTDLPPLVTSSGGGCCCTDLLCTTPNMIGGVFGAGSGKIAFSNIPPAHFAKIQMPNPAESVLGRQTIADDSSPLPKDRFFFDYDYFYRVPLLPREETVNRFTSGVEKTFFDGMMSAEVRVPFGTTLNNDLLVKQGRVVHGITGWKYRSGEEFLLGNVAIGAKTLLYRRPDELAISSGLLVTVPTANDLSVTGLLTPLHTPSATLRVKNEAVHIAPYLGALWTPTGRLFLQGFVQVDFDANGQQVVLENGASSADLGKFRDQTFVYFDAGIGYWIAREQWIDWAAIFEVHYNASLDSPSAINITPGQVNLGSGDGSINLVDLVLGNSFRLQDNTTLSLAYIFAVGAGQDEQYTREWRAAFNWYF